MDNAKEKTLNYLNNSSTKIQSNFVNKYKTIIKDVNNGQDPRTIEKDKYYSLFDISLQLDSAFIPYSEITRIVYSLSKTDGLDMLYPVMEENLLNYLNEHKDMNGTFMIKVIEHTKLASTQFDNLYARSENEIQNLTTNTQKLKKQQDSINKNYKEIKAENQHLSSNLITILGIFTAITFAIFGGLQLLGNVFGKAISSKGTSHFLVGNSIVLGGIFILAIYAIMLILFEGIGKLTKQNIGLSIKTMWLPITIAILIVVAGLAYSHNMF